MRTFNWGIVGLGHIAHEFAESMTALHPIYGAASRSLDSALEFQKRFGAKKAYGSYEELFSDEAVDIVYIAAVNNCHYPLIMEALSHGKHVLCEKAIWGNWDELKTAYDLAASKGLLLCEAMTIRRYGASACKAEDCREG